MELTYFLAQLIGLYCLIVGVLIFFKKKLFIEFVNEFLRAPATLFFPGLVAIFLGLLMVLSHNYWNAGNLTLLVTLVGWAALLKGLALLFIPKTAVRWIQWCKLEKFSWLYAVIVLLIGLYLAHAGFTHTGLLH